MKDRIDIQNEEFDAVDRLVKQYKRITLIAVVDDDYPEVRHGYENAVRSLIKAFQANGRI